MSLCYLYFESIVYPHIQNILDAFEDSLSTNIDVTDSIDDYDIYIIEVNNANKEIAQKLVNIFKKKQHSLIYFIIPKNHSLLFFQLTFLLETKSVITYNQNIEKLISKIKIDRETFVQNTFERWLGRIKIKTQNFIIYKNDALIFVNKPLLTFFGCSDSNLFELNILSQVNIEQLLDKDLTLSVNILDITSVKKRYTLKSLNVSENEKIIYIELDSSQQKHLGFMSSRVAFIELLKENILQRNISDKELSLLTININNIKKLLLEYKIVEFEEILLDTLSYMENILEKKLVFSQFENHFYVVLFEDIDFEQINTIADHFHTKVLNYINTKNNKISIDLFTFDLKNQEFSKILTTLNTIENEDFKEDENNTNYIKYLTKKDREITAKSLLDDAYNDKLDFKILNIYNGLVINTASKIVKITDENIYITFESLQGVMLNLEKRTVLQSKSFSQDIYAEVKQIHFNKKIAVLENFKFLKTNANSRKYARVTTPIKIPISINIQGKKVNGVIIDISIKSIAIKVKHTPKIAKVELNQTTLIFNIADKDSHIGYVQLKLSAKIIVVTEVDKDGYYKVICDLDQDSHDLNIVLKYVYERQKELIIELKKMSKLN